MYLFPILSLVMVSFAGFYTAILISPLVPVSDSKREHFDNYLIYGMWVSNTDPDIKLDTPVAPPSTPAAPVSGTAGAQQRTSDPAGAVKALPQADKPQPDPAPRQKMNRYGRGTIAVSVAAFLGAYLWSLIYLARRVTNFDLSPFSFLRATIQICLACFVCIFIRHFYDAVSQLVWDTTNGSRTNTPANGSWILALAFLIGFYPALGLNYLQERFSFLRFKSRGSSVEVLSRELPLEMIDGIDSYIKFRLGEYEIEDVENLALANPIQLYIETPYSLLKVIDWIGQAQLLLEIDNSKILDLRNMNVRTSLDLLNFAKDENGKKMLAGVLMPTQATVDQAGGFMDVRLRTFAEKPHVKQLVEVVAIITAAEEPRAVCNTYSRLSGERLPQVVGNR